MIHRLNKAQTLNPVDGSSNFEDFKTSRRLEGGIVIQLLDFLDERVEITTLFDTSIKHLSFISLNLQALSMLYASLLLAVDRSKFGNPLTH